MLSEEEPMKCVPEAVYCNYKAYPALNLGGCNCWGNYVDQITRIIILTWDCLDLVLQPTEIWFSLESSSCGGALQSRAIIQAAVSHSGNRNMFAKRVTQILVLER
jgi:hypothetical protein